MNFINLTLLTFLLLISQIKCIDIKLSLLKKEDNTNKITYPVAMTFKDNEIQKNDKNISFLCVFDYEPKSSQFLYFKSLMTSIVKNLTLKDKITFITFENYYRNSRAFSHFINSELNNVNSKIAKEYFHIDLKNGKRKKVFPFDEEYSNFNNIF